jgi:hypothetical protein
MKRARDDAAAGAPLIGHELRARLNALEFGLQPGDATIEVAGHDAAVARQRVLPRDDGTVVDRINPVGIDPATGLLRQPVWSTTAATDASYDRRWNEAMQAWQNPLEHEPWTPALRILAGATGTTVERLLDPESLRNVTQYDAQMREWASKERENRMMPASEKQRHINTLVKERTQMVTDMNRVRTTGARLQWCTELMGGFASRTGMEGTDFFGLGAVLFVKQQFEVVKSLFVVKDSISAADLYAQIKKWFLPDDDAEGDMFENVICEQARVWLLDKLESDKNNNALQNSKHEWIMRMALYLVIRHEFAASYTRMHTSSLPKAPDGAMFPAGPVQVVVHGSDTVSFPELAMNTLKHAVIAGIEYKMREFDLWADLQPAGNVPHVNVTAFSDVALAAYKTLPGLVQSGMRMLLPLDTLLPPGNITWETVRETLGEWEISMRKASGVTIDIERMMKWLETMRIGRTHDTISQLCARLIAHAVAGVFPQGATPDSTRLFYAFLCGAFTSNDGVTYSVDMDTYQLHVTIAPNVNVDEMSTRTGNNFDPIVAYADEARYTIQFALDPPLINALANWLRTRPTALEPVTHVVRPASHTTLWHVLCSWIISKLALYPNGGAVFFEHFWLVAKRGRTDNDYHANIETAWKAYYIPTADVKNPFAKYNCSVTLPALNACIVVVKTLTGEFLAYQKALLQHLKLAAPNDTFMATMVEADSGLYALAPGDVPAPPPVEGWRTWLFENWSKDEKAEAFFWSIAGSATQRVKRLGLFDWLSLQELANGTVLVPANTTVLLAPHVQTMVDLWQTQILGKRQLELAPALNIIIALGSYAIIATHALDVNARELIVKIDAVIAIARDEWRRLVTDTDTDMQRIIARARALYTGSRSWNLRPEFTGRIQLSDLTINALDEAYSRVREYLPDLRRCTLDQLGTASRDSGLVGAFMRLVATGTAALRLRFQTQYNTEAQHKASPKNQQDAMTALRAFAVRFGGADGKTVVSVQRRCGDGATLTYPVPAPPP